MKKIIILILTIILLYLNCFSQREKGLKEQFKKLSRPEKFWVLMHPFIAKKTWNYTLIARNITDSIQLSDILDKDRDGGQVDAFRHAYWMALLTQKIGWGKAYRLGKVHEKGNYLGYKKSKIEDNSVPDKVSCDMDLWNNNTGINIGKKYNNLSNDSLKHIVIQNILDGKMKIIRKNSKGEFLDINYNIISSESIKGKWETDKVLDFSNHKNYIK